MTKKTSQNIVKTSIAVAAHELHLLFQDSVKVAKQDATQQAKSLTLFQAFMDITNIFNSLKTEFEKEGGGE